MSIPDPKPLAREFYILLYKKTDDIICCRKHPIQIAFDRGSDEEVRVIEYAAYAKLQTELDEANMRLGISRKEKNAALAELAEAKAALDERVPYENYDVVAKAHIKAAQERDAALAEVERVRAMLSLEKNAHDLTADNEEKLEKERDQLKAEVERLKGDCEEMRVSRVRALGGVESVLSTRFEKQANELRAQLTRAKEALEFYSHSVRYSVHHKNGYGLQRNASNMSVMDVDAGHVARQALGQKENK